MSVDRAQIPLEELLPLVGAAVARYRRRLLTGHGVTPTAVAVLAALRDDDPGGPPSHRDLAGRLRLSPATLTPVLDALEAAGAVRRERDRLDRRVVRVVRTRAGRARLAASQPRSGLPRPAPEIEPALRAYLLAVLDAAEGWT